MALKKAENFIGQVLRDRYRVQSQLGKQGGRITLLTQDLTTQQSVIVKLLLFDREMSWDDLKLFEREIETLKSLSHPAIPRYLDSFEVEFADCKGFALVQSYIEAQSLQGHLARGRRFKEREIKQIVESLLEILAYLHQRQPPVIHRDIKPSNILLADERRNGISSPHIYLVDFGSVQTLAKQEGQTVTVVGTYGYMPPEQFGGRATPASDLYSLGATAIALSTGIHPADLPQDALRLNFEKKARFSPGFAAWLKKMANPSLENRFQTAKEALEALKKKHATATKNISTLNLLWQFFWRSTFAGGVAGLSYGVLYGIASGSGGRTIFLGCFGFILGIFFGALNGLLTGIVTRLFFFPLKNSRRYRQILISLSTFGFLVVLTTKLWPAILKAEWTTTLTLILGLSMGAISQFLARWYESRSYQLPTKQ